MLEHCGTVVVAVIICVEARVIERVVNLRRSVVAVLAICFVFVTVVAIKILEWVVRNGVQKTRDNCMRQRSGQNVRKRFGQQACSV